MWYKCLHFEYIYVHCPVFGTVVHRFLFLLQKKLFHDVNTIGCPQLGKSIKKNSGHPQQWIHKLSYFPDSHRSINFAHVTPLKYCVSYNIHHILIVIYSENYSLMYKKNTTDVVYLSGVSWPKKPLTILFFLWLTPPLPVDSANNPTLLPLPKLF